MAENLPTPQPVGVGSVSVLPGLWDQSSSLRFSPRAHIIRPQQAHYELPEINHPGLLKIIKHTTKGYSVEANSNGRRGGGGGSVSRSNSSHNKYKTELTLLDDSYQNILKRGGPQQQS